MFRILLLVLILLTGCERQEPAPSPESLPPQAAPPAIEGKPLVLLHEPVEALLVETAAEAIPVWRQHAEVKPALLLLSQNPFLQPVPERMKEVVLELARTGGIDDFKRKATPNVPAPAMHPDMALSAALEAGFFSRVIWALPQESDEAVLSPEIFLQHLLETGTATEAEIESFRLEGDRLSGALRGVPVSVLLHRDLNKLLDPVVAHIDLGFFKQLYGNEIKTPIHPLVRQVLDIVRASGQEGFAVTLSHANESGAVSLQVRFLGGLLKRLFGSPQLLGAPLAGNDLRRHNALYLSNFFQKEKQRELYLAMEKEAPEDASVKYDLFRTASEFKEGERALAYLAEAVALDPGYALEYLDLAERALEKRRPDAALQMLENAEAAYPENPFIRLRRAEILERTGHAGQAKKLIEDLLRLPWSDFYYRHVVADLRARLERVEEPAETHTPEKPE